MKQEKTIHFAMCYCEICGKESGLIFDKRLLVKDPFEGKGKIHSGICNDCKGVLDSGGIMIVEVRDEEPDYRTGKVVGLSERFREANQMPKGKWITVRQSDLKMLLGDMYDYKTE